MNLKKLIPPPGLLLMLFLGILIPLLIIGEIAEHLLVHERFAFEQPLMLAVRQHTQNCPITYLALILHWIGKWPAATSIAALIAWYELRNLRPNRAVFVILSTALPTAVMSAAKAFFSRTRPEFWPRIVEEQSASFPSGHSTFAAALATTVVILCWQSPHRAWIILGALSFTLLAGFSRIVLGVHYPTDVLVGWLTGMSTVIGIYQLMRNKIKQSR
ncbi:phosphatase PAP2 family protein [Neisseria canis]|nr:phosphatase PAP2 family protein [Neisseria canis]